MSKLRFSDEGEKRRKMPLRSEVPDPVDTTSKSMLEFINLVVKNTKKASWVSTVPSDFGQSKTGTLKADEWRSFSTIHLPIALVLLWGRTSRHSTPHIADTCLRHLNHTMSLVQALCLACYRTTTPQRTQSMHTHLRNYLTDLQVVHKGVKPTTIGHMSLHLAKFMELFGPVHSWWTYPFERLIGQLQHLPTNNKFGESLRPRR